VLLFGGIVAAIAGLIHVWIFLLESVWFSRPSVYGRFGLRSEQDARVVHGFAFNQGFYNLFLAVGVAAGVFLVVVDSDAGMPLLVFGCGSMAAASLVLVLSDRTKARAALVQGALPAVALLSLLVDSIAS